MLEIVCGPECMVERPWAAEFERDTRGRSFIAPRSSVRNEIGFDSLEDIARRGASHERLSPDQPDRRLRKFLQLPVRKIALRLVCSPGLCGDPRIRNLSGR